MSLSIIGGQGFAGLTQNSGTVINALLQPRSGGHTRLQKLVYTPGATTHVITALRPVGGIPAATGLPYTGQPARAQAAAAGAQAVVNITIDPGVMVGGGIAANDFVAILEMDGIVRAYKVQSVAAGPPIAVTLTANLTKGCALSAPVWWFGAGITGIDNNSGLAQQTFTATTGSPLTLTDDTQGLYGILSTYWTNQPMLLQSANGTNAGTFTSVIYGWTAPGFAGGPPNS